MGALHGHSEKPFWADANAFVRKVPVGREGDG